MGVPTHSWNSGENAGILRGCLKRCLAEIPTPKVACPHGGHKEQNTLPLMPRQGFTWLNWNRTRRFSRRLFRCFGHTSREALVAPEEFREDSHSAEALPSKLDSLGGCPRTPALVHLAVLIQWTAVFRLSHRMEQTSCVDAVTALGPSHSFAGSFWEPGGSNICRMP